MQLHAQTLVFTALSLIVAGRAGVAQKVTVSGNPSLLRISNAVAGFDPTSVSTSATTYSVTTPGRPDRTYTITMQLNANMPGGVTLTATLAAPPGATSLGAVALEVTARNVVAGIKKHTSATQSITYALAATAAAGIIPNSSRTVTLTVIQSQ